MNLSHRLSENRRNFELESQGKWWRRYLSAAEYQLDRALVRRLASIATGRFLDAGCGAMPYRSLVSGRVSDYVALDIESRAPGVDIIADIQSMAHVESAAFDTVLCTEVLEHVPRPVDAIKELARVLAPGGILVLTAPHLSRIHEAPHDYQRFTRYGLAELASTANLEVVELTEIGSVFSLIAHQVSTALVVSVWHVPVLRWIALTAVTLTITIPAVTFDRLPGFRRLLPLNHVMLARRASI